MNAPRAVYPKRDDVTMGQPSWSPPLGERLPPPYARFIPVQTLGAPGGQGAVFLARDERQPERPLCTLKFPHVPVEALRPGDVRDRFISGFLAEAALGQQLKHPNLAVTRELLDFRECRDAWPAEAPPVALAMNFYEPSLAELLTQYPHARFAAEDVARWLRDVAEALAYLHGRPDRYVHRDLKPENLLFETPRGYTGPDSLRHAHLVLADFGTLAREGQCCPAVCRTERDRWKSPAHYPPWDSTGPPREYAPTPAMDLYALGELCTVLAARTTGPTQWLQDAAAACQAVAPPRAADLRPRLSPAWDAQLTLFKKSGFDPAVHTGFVGRKSIFKRFEAFARANHGAGGFFVIEAQPGVGKSALLTNWAARVGQLIGFYFRFRSTTSPARAMPISLSRQLCAAYRLEFREPGQADDPGVYLKEVLHQAARCPQWPERLLIFVDALDEAVADQRSNKDSREWDPNQGPVEAVSYLPRELPEGVFVVLSTRPHARGADHVGLLSGPPVEVVPLRHDSAENREDVEEFFRTQLGAHVTAEQARALAEDTGGLFLLARLFTQAILRGQFTVAQTLALAGSWHGVGEPADRLRACYQGIWDRIRAGEVEAKRKLLERLMGVLHVAYQWLSLDELSDILSWEDRQTGRSPAWDECDLKELLHALTWYLDEEERDAGTFYQVRHKTVREFLQSARGPFTEKYARQMHALLGSYFCGRAAKESRGWSAVEPYGRYFAVRHLTQSGDPERLQSAAGLLCDLGYLQSTLGDRNETASGGPHP
jgi:hypothetical protein